jgi:predicted site-specific integrase-resolvase
MAARLDTTAKRLLTHSRAAKIRDVSPRTLDRWIAEGIIPEPIKINKRKYHRVEDIEVPPYSEVNR